MYFLKVIKKNTKLGLAIEPNRNRTRRGTAAGFYTHVLPQQLLPVQAEVSEVLARPFTFQQGVECGLKVPSALEAQQRLPQVAPPPDLWKRTNTHTHITVQLKSKKNICICNQI